MIKNTIYYKYYKNINNFNFIYIIGIPTSFSRSFCQIDKIFIKKVSKENKNY